MSASELREAAAKMRERAEFAQPGPWVQNGFEYDDVADWFTYDIGVSDGSLTSLGYINSKDDADHIASWHPAVALAVADWLEATALRLESYLETFAPGSRAGAATAAENTQGLDQALAVARAYLGSDR